MRSPENRLPTHEKKKKTMQASNKLAIQCRRAPLKLRTAYPGDTDKCDATVTTSDILVSEHLKLIYISTREVLICS